jgi:hypothetical protein
MSSSVQASDSNSSGTSSQVKGLAQIALGAAAGAFAASRMSRGGLMLTAGLAFALWKKGQSSKSVNPQPSTAPEAVRPLPEPSLPLPELPTVLSDFAETSPPVPVEPVVPEISPVVSRHVISPPSVMADEPQPVLTAWNELRAALAPTPTSDLTKAEPSLPSTLTVVSPPVEVDDLPEPPPMIEMSIYPPSSPLVLTTIHDGVDVPDEIELPYQPETQDEEPEAHSLMFSDPEEPSRPISLGLSGSLIVAKPMTQPLTSSSPVDHSSLSAPVVVPRDVQAKKSFFDWLRG